MSILDRFMTTRGNMDVKRSRFDMPHKTTTTYTSGKLIPIYIKEIIPGDSVRIDMREVTRMLTPAVPTMDVAYSDKFFFFVPARIACIHEHDWQAIMGENFKGPWAPITEETLETTGNTLEFAHASNRRPVAGSIANYLGLPILKQSGPGSDYPKERISSLPFNAIRLIWNRFFRDENVDTPIDVLDTSKWIDECFTGNPYYVSKLHDAFTSLLPAPQKGQAITIPMLGEAPVYVQEELSPDVISSHLYHAYSGNIVKNSPVRSNETGVVVGQDGTAVVMGVKKSEVDGVQDKYSGYYADMSDVSGATINSLRLAFALQHIEEVDARNGTRFPEYLRAHWGITIPSGYVQEPEYLGGMRTPLNVDQVVQNVPANVDSTPTPLGNIGAFSNTFNSAHMVAKSFYEHGYLIGFCAVRTAQSYSQGVEPFWFKSKKYEFYDPMLANIGEQPVKKKIIFFGNDTAKNNQALGFQEAWWDYRSHPNSITGKVAPAAEDESLTPYTYTNKFKDYPVLNPDFLKQPSSQIGDTLIDKETDTQFLSDFFFDAVYTRAMPVYSIPGLFSSHI